jgi:D-alanyl-D-alanine carboxypeptidase
MSGSVSDSESAAGEHASNRPIGSRPVALLLGRPGWRHLPAMTLHRRLLPVVGALLLLGAAPAAWAQSAQTCDGGEGAWTTAAMANAVSLHSLEWAPFGSTEWGWEAYLPLIARELNQTCGPTTPDFARTLAEFQSRHGLEATGVFDLATFQVLKGLWQERRPFVMDRVRGEPCPEPPALSQLGYLVAEEEHADRLTRLLRRDVLQAYRRLVAAARAESPEIAAEPELLQIFSAFRDPEADAARCTAHNNCDGRRRAVCSAHRTGSAIDLYVGHLPGFAVDDTSIESRLHMTRGPAYRWLVANASRFGFTPYVFEPWHWEWVESRDESAPPAGTP